MSTGPGGRGLLVRGCGAPAGFYDYSSKSVMDRMLERRGRSLPHSHLASLSPSLVRKLGPFNAPISDEDAKRSFLKEPDTVVSKSCLIREKKHRLCLEMRFDG